MNHEQASLVGAPGVLHIAGVDEAGNPITHTYLVGKPTPSDLITYQKWVLARPLKNEVLGLSSEQLKGLSPEDKAMLFREVAKQRSGKRTPTEGEVLEITQSPDGVAMLVWLAARRFHEGLTYETIRKFVTAENVDQINADLDAAVQPQKGDETEGTVDPKKPVGATS